MAHSFSQRIHLLVDFLLGARLAETSGPLGDLGWTAEAMERGWRLVESAGRARYSAERWSADRTDAHLAAFKKRWFAVARIVLAKRHPEIAARLLGNSDLRSQATAAFVVEPFLRVIRQLEVSSDESERAARALLAERGLTKEHVDDGVRLVDQAHRIIAPKTAESLLLAEERAEEELWDFYQEWSVLARRQIASANVLRLLGLTKPGRSPRAAAKPAPTVHVLGSKNRDAAWLVPRLPAGSDSAAQEDAESEKGSLNPATDEWSGRERTSAGAIPRQSHGRQ